jgi:hypothetical protein
VSNRIKAVKYIILVVSLSLYFLVAVGLIYLLNRATSKSHHHSSNAIGSGVSVNRVAAHDDSKKKIQSDKSRDSISVKTSIVITDAPVGLAASSNNAVRSPRPSFGADKKLSFSTTTPTSIVIVKTNDRVSLMKFYGGLAFVAGVISFLVLKLISFDMVNSCYFVDRVIISSNDNWRLECGYLDIPSIIIDAAAVLIMYAIRPPQSSSKVSISTS